MKRMQPYHALVLAVALGATGCLNLGPRFRQPDLETDRPDRYQHAAGEEASPDADGNWWEDFGDEELNRLVDEVLEHNLDIRKAAASVLEIRAIFVQARADRLPSIDIQAEGRKQQQPIFGIMPGAGIVNKSDQFTWSLPASFELDLWGRLARVSDAARFDLLQAEETRRRVIQTIVAEAAGLYLQIESLERRLQITGESITGYRRSLAIVEGRYARGLTSILDVRQARRTLAQAEAALPPVRKDLGIAQQSLAVLAGRYPESKPARHKDEDYFKALPPVPPGLPSELLLRRPDIRAAEASLRGLNARVGVARADRFPRISLTGTLGYTSDDLSTLVRPESELWNMAAGAALPLFHAGRFIAAQRAAEARYRQGLAEYARTVLTAFAEVEGSLLTRKEELERRDRMIHFLAEARATQDAAEGRYARGLVNYLTVLEAQQVRFQAEESLILVDLAILGNRVTLYRALGGGWAKPKPAEHVTEKPFWKF